MVRFMFLPILSLTFKNAADPLDDGQNLEGSTNGWPGVCVL